MERAYPGQCPEGIPAAVEVLHTAADLLAWYPHAHRLFLAGAIMPDGGFQPVSVDQERLQALFADKVLEALKKEGLLTQADIENTRSRPQSGFNVFIGEPIAPGDTKRLLFATRYLKKCPVSNERLTIVDGSTDAGSADATIEYAANKDNK